MFFSNVSGRDQKGGWIKVEMNDSMTLNAMTKIQLLMQKRPMARRGVRPSEVLVHHICNLRYCCDSNASLQVDNDLCVA